MLIISFDLEFNPSQNKILEFGYFDNFNNSKRGQNIYQLLEVLNTADIIVGHNIIHHDLPVLRDKFNYQPKTNLFIDTLYISSLLFAEKPYHRLTKDYINRLSFDELYHPDFDSEIALKKLLPDLQKRWDNLSSHMKCIYQHLIGEVDGFSGFFKLLNYNPQLSLNQAFSKLPKAIFCSSKPLNDYAKNWPLELAYCLAIINAETEGSILPAWITHSYPKIVDLLEKLRFSRCYNDSCGYCLEHLSSAIGLKKYFGYSGYRRFSEQEVKPLQQVIVEQALDGGSILAILPTGGGKSLCYQVPALMAHEQKGSLTLVISPLQSLMKDQVDNLKARNIYSAYTINGAMDPISRMEAVHAVENGLASMLFISPESLRSNSIFRLLRKRHIERVVIDEAHCFSSWGHDFRPDYFYIASFIKRLEEAQPWSLKLAVSCFTATAKPQVVEDIQTYFQDRLQIQLKPLITNASRTNLSYQVIATKDENKFDELLRLLGNITGPTIIYAARTRRCQELVDNLKKHNIDALIYHGQLEVGFKKKQQEMFMNGEVDLIIATSAFGMGVDKSDITNVIHYEISSSLENYVQEAGRAGRDKSLQAKCHILFDEEDLQKHFTLLNATKINKKEISQIWRALKAFKRKKFSKSALEIAEKAGWDTELKDLETRVKTAIASLEESGFIRREDNATRVYASSILVKNFDEARLIIEQNSGLDNEKELEKPIRIMQYLISRQETQVDTIAMHLGLNIEVVGYWITRFKDWKLLSEGTELEAAVSMKKSKHSSESKFYAIAHIEKKLIKHFSNENEERIKIHLKELHDEIHLEEQGSETFHIIQKVLSYWELSRKIKKTRMGSDPNWLEIDFKNSPQEKLDQISQRNSIAQSLLTIILRLAKLESGTQENGDVKVSFTTTQLQILLEKELEEQVPNIKIEEALYFLIMMEVISTKGGLLVFYKPMRIKRLEETKRQYTSADFKLMQDFYDRKTEQVHIVGEYAKKMLRSHLEALTFVNDYFNLDYRDFLNKYFRREKGKIKRPISDRKFREIFGPLSSEQSAVIQDNKSNKILVGAGPGSGKTKILVHKVASILLMEDVKPEQFLMLTFSRPSANEMKYRLNKLIGSAAFGVDIKTFHSFAFDIVGKKGDLDRSSKIISEACKELKDEGNFIPSIGKKEVIVVDEFQDIDEDQYRLLNIIIEQTENARVIIVGDDDQNIYEFRGSSIKYMKEFADDSNCTKFFLTRNFRSKYNLVEFSNSFLYDFPDERLKTNKELIPHNQENGKLELHIFPQKSEPIKALVQKALDNGDAGHTAILTRTNEESLLVHHLLIKAGIKSKLVLGQTGYRVQDILEIEAFTHWLKQSSEKGTGRISEKQWKEIKGRLSEKFNNSSSLTYINEIIDSFEASRKHLFKSEWIEFITELRTEDVGKSENESVWISTMHKAKGKEFDNVYLYLNDIPLKTSPQYRLLYVAITRAKSNLYIFSNDENLVPYLGKRDSLIQHRGSPALPHLITLQLGLGDIHLGLMKKASVQDVIKGIQSGASLSISDEEDRLILNGETLSFSKKFQAEKLLHWRERGYTLQSAYVEQIIVWYDKIDEHEYRIALPRVTLKKMM